MSFLKNYIYIYGFICLFKFLDSKQVSNGEYDES
jgi:hypothetical protein